MTDKYNTITVVMDRPRRDDDAKPIIAAIRQIRGVLSAKGNVEDHRDYMAQARAREEYRQKFISILWPEND